MNLMTNYIYTITREIREKTEINGNECYTISNIQQDSKYILDGIDYINSEGKKLVEYGYEFNEKVTDKKLSFKYKFNGIYYNSIEELIYNMKHLKFKNTKSPTVHSKPHIILDYPLFDGKKWHLCNIEGFFSIDKKVIGTETIEIMGEQMEAVKIENIYTGIDGIEYYEWYNELGEIKNYSFYKDIEIYDENGNYLGTGNVYETVYLIEYDLK